MKSKQPSFWRHETDHLDGELYVSKVEGQLMDTEEYYEQMDGTEVLDEE